MTLIQSTSPILFFTGKGGVGKTSSACAAAVELADAGKRVLLVSTDPASNLDEVLETQVGDSAPTSVPSVPGLSALNIDPEAAARAYRERVVGPYRGILPAGAVASIEEQLSGACTVEIAAFDRFAQLLADSNANTDYDHIIFDTAPTGHTLRLLELPAAWTGFFDTNTTGTSCLGPLGGLGAASETYAAALEALRDPARTRIVLVTRPDDASIREAERTAVELSALEIENFELVVNGVFTADDSDDALAVAMATRCSAALAELPSTLSSIEHNELPLLGDAPMGIAGLRRLARATAPDSLEAGLASQAGWSGSALTMGDLIDELARPGRGVIMTMGKGGVGKTTAAAQIALSLAERGHSVHLTTTDPAAHVRAALGDRVSELRVSRIDPATETAAYTEEVMATAGKGLDEKGRALLEEDLRSPCTEEIAVFQAFARIAAEGDESFVVIDTAPTGHTLLLLDAAQSYHREVERKPGSSMSSVRTLLPRLRDPERTRVLLVTLPEATPVHEALQLQADLARAEIKPFAWLVNQALTGQKITHPLLLQRQAGERRFIDEVVANSDRVAIAPLRP